MNVRIAAILAAVAALAAGCGPDPFVRPERSHEVHTTLYDARPQTQPPPDLAGLPRQEDMHPAPPASSGPVGEPPGPAYIWIPGYYAHTGNTWHWIPGGWWLPERGKQWVPGRWTAGPGGTLYWSHGYWQ